MRAIVFHGVGDIRVDTVPEPKIKDPSDAIIKITASAICGTDLHMVRGTMAMMEPGTILGHEGVGIVQEVGPGVRNLSVGDRVVVASTIACGYCSYCRSGYYSQCDNANPQGKLAGTAFFGGPKMTGPFQGLQAEYARVPFANVGCVKLPDTIDDAKAILLSDIFPTGYFGAKLAEIRSGNTVAIFGCGPVGIFTIISAKLLGAGRVLAIDSIPSRLDMAKKAGAEVINFEKEDPVDAILSLTGSIGVDRVIDAVGIDAQIPSSGPAAQKLEQQRERYAKELKQVAPQTGQKGDSWKPGSAPSLVLEWGVQALAKAGTLSIIGVYPETLQEFPLGKAMEKNITMNMGNCNHRKYLSRLVDLVASGAVDPSKFLTKVCPLSEAVDAYKHFDKREEGWLKVEILPGR